jgi:hypothetical protein
MRALAPPLLRIALVALCCLATAKSIRHARAEWFASSNTTPGLARALQIEPDDHSLTARAALIRGASGEDSPAMDLELRRAAQLNPFNSEVLTDLGLREELDGNLADAELHLTQATRLNHAFKPAWALASFCYRTGQPSKFWPMVKHCLSLDPLLFDTSPVFDLCWEMTGDSKKILASLPRTGPIPFQYLTYLIGKSRVDAAAELWPEVLQLLDGKAPAEVAAALEYSTFLLRNNRIEGAVHAWNQLIDRGIVRAGKLDPATGASVSDPDFAFAPVGSPFDWQVARTDGVFATTGRSGVTFEFDGNQPQTILLMSTLAPLIPAKSYRVIWKADSAGLDRRDYAGFFLRITQSPGAITDCPLSEKPADSPCQFTTGTDPQSVRIELRYTRALGTTRPRGTLQISSLRLEFTS